MHPSFRSTLLLIVIGLLSSCSSPKTLTSFWMAPMPVWDGVSAQVQTVSIHVNSQGIIDVIAQNLPALPTDPVVHYQSGVLIPGFINAHIHLLNPPSCKPGKGFVPTTPLTNARQVLQSGFTTVADMGSWPDLVVSYKTLFSKRVDLGPRLLIAGPIVTIPGGYPENWIPSEAKKVGAVRFINDPRLLDDLKRWQVDYIKMGMQEGSLGGKELPFYSEENLKSFIDQVHHQGKKFFAHALTRQGYALALGSNADGILHGSHELLDEKTLNAMAQKNMPVIPTVWVWKNAWDVPENDLDQMYGWRDQVSKKQWDQWQLYLNDYKNSGDSFPSSLVDEEGIKKNLAQQKHRILQKNIQAWKEAGIPFAFGTDAPFCFNTAFNSFEEIRELKKAGLSNKDVLNMLTQNAARFLGIENQAGSIQVGRKADMVVVLGDPFADIHVLEKPVAVYREGHLITKAPLGLKEKFLSVYLLVKAFLKTVVS